MAKGNKGGQGYKRANEPGGIYVIRAICDAFELATGMMLVKIGISYKGREGTLNRAIEHKTSCPHSIDIVRTFAVDWNTVIPSVLKKGFQIGGVHEMERYLHHVMEELGYEHVGDGTEWFAVPLDLISNPKRCPELQEVMAAAPAWRDVKAFETLGHDVNVTTKESKAILKANGITKKKDAAIKGVNIR